MTKIDDEVAFLRRFGRRFSKKETYLAALADMLDEGIITKKAYETIVKEKNVNVPITPQKVAKRTAKIVNEKPEPDYDP